MAPSIFTRPDGTELVYPVPVMVRNTFIEIPALDEIYQERKVKSCPTSMIELFEDAQPCEPVICPDNSSECSTTDTLEELPGAVMLVNAPAVTAPDAGPAFGLSVPQVAMPRYAPPSLPARFPPAVLSLEAALPMAPRQAAGPPPPPVKPPGPVRSGHEEPKLPSLGSASHPLCKPCSFMFKGGCRNGEECGFCHLTHADPKEFKKRRKQERLASLRQHLAEPAQDSRTELQLAGLVFGRLASRGE